MSEYDSKFKEKNHDNKYMIGVDMGSNSSASVVLDENLNIIKKKGHNMASINLFE